MLDEQEQLPMDFFEQSPDGWNDIMVDPRFPVGVLINNFLSAINDPRRAIMVLFGDEIRAWDVMTLQEARETAQRLRIDPDTSNFSDPQEGRISKQLKRKLGLLT